MTQSLCFSYTDVQSIIIEPTMSVIDISTRNRLTDYCRDHCIRRLSLFGSQATGSARPDSDIDLLVEFDPGMEPGLIGLAAMESELSSLLGDRKVDLRTPRELSRHFRERVMRDALVQYVA
jgi:predicted nucleotidyltransferase